jgi:hypothetical protein
MFAGHSWARTGTRAALVAALVAIAVFALPGTGRADTYPSSPTVQIVSDDLNQLPPLPPGFYPDCLAGPDSLYDPGTCPVIVWGDYTYWVLSPADNTRTMLIVAYDAADHIAGEWTVPGDRYIWQITIDDTAQTISLYGQYYDFFGARTIPWSEIYINSAVPTSTHVTFGPGPFTYTGSAFTATATVDPAGSGSADIAYSGDCTNVGDTCTATATYAGDATHQPSSDQTSITIDPATPTTPAVSNLPASATFGDSGFTAAVTTNGDGATSVSSSTPSVCTVAGDGATVSYAGAGTCTLTAHVAAGTDYLAADGSPQSFAVQKATPTLAWATPAQILYGTPLGSAQLDATASTPGTFSYTPGTGAVLTPGSHALTATFTPADPADWNGGTVATTVTVGFSSSCLTGLHLGAIAVHAGQAVCIGAGARLAGPIRVDGGSLWIDDASVLALIDSTHASAIGVCDSSVNGLVSIRSSTGPVVFGDGAGCAGNHLGGGIAIDGNAGGVSLVGNTVVGLLDVRNNSGGFAYSGNTVHGRANVANNS